MSFRIRTIALIMGLCSVLHVGAAHAQTAPSPLTGFMVSGGFGSLSGEGGTTWYPMAHLAGTGHSGWGGDLGFGVNLGDETGFLFDLAVTHVFASTGSPVGVMVLLGPSLISEGQGDQVFGISGGAALLVRLAPHLGLRLDATPRIYFSGANGTHPAIVVSLSLTSLPGGWRGK